MLSSTPRLRPFRLLALLALLSAATVVRAQEETVVDELGNTIVQSVVTNALGAPIQTLVLETLAPAVVDPAAEETDTDTAVVPVAAPTTATTTATTETTTAAVDDVDTRQGVVQQPAATCTTEGCPPRPTVYTYNGALTTWYATTPATPIPTWTSSGQILNVASYISTTASGSSGRNGASSRYSSSFAFGTAGDWGIMAGVAVVGGLVGAVAVL